MVTLCRTGYTVTPCRAVLKIRCFYCCCLFGGNTTVILWGVLSHVPCADCNSGWFSMIREILWLLVSSFVTLHLRAESSLCDELLCQISFDRWFRFILHCELDLGREKDRINSEWRSASCLGHVVIGGSAVVSVLVLVPNIHRIYWLPSSCVLLPLPCLQQQMYRCWCVAVRTRLVNREACGLRCGE